MAASSKAFWGKEQIVEKSILDLIAYNRRLMDSLKKFGKKYHDKFGTIFRKYMLTAVNRLAQKERKFSHEVKKLKKYDKRGDVKNAIYHANNAIELIKQCENIIIAEFRTTMRHLNIQPDEKDLREKIINVLTEERRQVKTERFFLTSFKARIRQ